MTDDKNRQAPTDQEGAPSADQATKGQEPGHVVHEYTLPRTEKKIIVDTPKRGHRAEEIAEYLKTDEGKAAVESLKETIINVSDVVGPAIKALQEAPKIAESITSAVQRVREIQFDISKIVQAMMQANISTWAPAELDFEALEKFYTEIEELAPYLEAEIKKYPEYEGKSYTDLIDELPFSALPDLITAATDTDTNTEEPAETEPAEAEEPAEGEEIDPEEERIYQIITDLLTIRDAARAAKAAEAEAKARAEAEQEQLLPAVTYTNKPGIELTTDKLMTVFFGANAPAAPKGQIPGQMAFIPVKYEETGAPEITLYYTYEFDNDLFTRLKLEKKTDDEDYFILSLIANYWRMGDRNVSVSKMYKDLTGDNPNNKQLTALTNRLIKIAGINVYINDREVRSAWGIEDEKKTYREVLTPLAPIRVGAERFVARGQVVEAGIEILAEPDIMKLGHEMGQFTTIPKNLLYVKKKDGRRLSRTSRFYRVLHFLIRRIAGMKSGRLSAKILYDKFYSDTGETTARGKQLARDCMYTILDHFKECDKWITGYREETTPSTGKVGVRIFYSAPPKNKKIASKKK